ncbi:putative Regulator [uncultured Gammaproteobacteria bacterium]
MANILVVEDDLASREYVRLVLEKGGHKPDCIENGQLAIDLIKRGEKYDLIITDLMMPGVDGFDVILAIRKMSPRTKVVIVSAVQDKIPGILRDQFQQRLKIDGTMQKPFRPAQLLTLVEEVLARR